MKKQDFDSKMVKNGCIQPIQQLKNATLSKNCRREYVRSTRVASIPKIVQTVSKSLLNRRFAVIPVLAFNIARFLVDSQGSQDLQIFQK